MEWVTKTFVSFQSVMDYCYSKNIPLEKIEKYSSPKDLYWRYIVRYLERGE